MALPLTRDQTFANGTPIEPETLNAMQDQIIGLHSQAQDVLYPSSRWLRTGGTKQAGYLQGFDEAYVSARLRPGTAIASISFRVRSPSGSDGISFYVYEHSSAGYTGAPIAIFEGLETAGVDSTYVLSMPSNYVYPSNRHLELVVASSPVDSCRLYSASINLA